MVMELVEGDCLRDLISEGRPLHPRRAVEVTRQVVLALSTAHRLGVIHRDVKPGNIMLTSDGTVKVADFGIARAWNHSTDLTRTGSIIGTATYFSPEQAQGRSADRRSDIYSLGVVLYEMLVGRPPFQGETPMAVAYQHVTTDVLLPPPVIPRSLRSWTPSCFAPLPRTPTTATRTQTRSFTIWRRG